MDRLRERPELSQRRSGFHDEALAVALKSEQRNDTFDFHYKAEKVYCDYCIEKKLWGGGGQVTPPFLEQYCYKEG